MKLIYTDSQFVPRWLSGLTLSMALIAMISTGLGCASHEDSATMKEARALNEETQALARQLETRLDVIADDLSARLKQASHASSVEHNAEHSAEHAEEHAEDASESVEHTEGLAELHWAENLEVIASLGDRLAAWSANQVLLPGQTCNHDHGDGHAHNHGTAMNDLSDEDHLELQEAIRAELDAMIAELDKLTP